MPTFHLLNDKLEAALAALVMAAAPGLQVLTGKSSDDNSLPSAICTATTEGDEEPKNSGNYPMRGVVELRTSAVVNEDGAADETAAAHKTANQALASTVFGALQIGDLVALLNAQGQEMTVFPASIQFEAPESGYGEKGQWIDRISFRCLACGSVLAA